MKQVAGSIKAKLAQTAKWRPSHSSASDPDAATQRLLKPRARLTELLKQPAVLAAEDGRAGSASSSPASTAISTSCRSARSQVRARSPSYLRSEGKGPFWIPSVRKRLSRRHQGQAEGRNRQLSPNPSPERTSTRDGQRMPSLKDLKEPDRSSKATQKITQGD